MSLSSESRGPCRPLVLVPACNRRLGPHDFHVAGWKYVAAVRLAGCMPWVVPSAEPDEVDSLLALADGVLLTGSPSNVDPAHFGEAVHDAAAPLDRLRDAWTLPLIPQLLARGIPLFAICRGFQELNVALGGSLHQAVHGAAVHLDHRADAQAPAEDQYGASHGVNVVPGGMLARITQRVSLRVNSVHAQGVKRLADALQVEARAEDGLVEAVSVTGAAGFALGVQWHPEWQAADNPVSMQLLRAFGDACRAHRDRRSMAASASRHAEGVTP